MIDDFTSTVVGPEITDSDISDLERLRRSIVVSDPYPRHSLRGAGRRGR